MHSGYADPCGFPVSGEPDCIICGSGELSSRSPLRKKKKKLKGRNETLILILCLYNVNPYFISYSIPRSSCETDDNIEYNDDKHNENKYLLQDRNFSKPLLLFSKKYILLGIGLFFLIHYANCFILLLIIFQGVVLQF